MSGVGLSHVKEATIRLIIPFEVDSRALAKSGTSEVEDELDKSTFWCRPEGLLDDLSIRDLDELTKAAFFDEKDNGFVYRKLKVGHFTSIQWPQGEHDNNIEIPLGSKGVEIFLNPQGSGAISLSLHLGAEQLAVSVIDLRQFIYQLGQVDLRNETKDEITPANWDAKIREYVLKWIGPLGKLSGLHWLRRFLIVGVRFGSNVGPFPLRDLSPESEAIMTLMWALGAGLRPDKPVLPMPGVQIAALNPFHMAGVFESGAAHVVVDSMDNTKHNGARISWVAGTYSLLTIHELLYRNAAVNLIREARQVAELAPLEDEGNGSRESLPSESPDHVIDIRGKAVAGLSRRLIEFQLYADVNRAGAFQAIRTYYRMASTTLGGHDSLVRLRQAVTALEQVEVTEKSAASSEKMVQLQEKVELLEVFFFGYYLIAVMHYIFHAFHISQAFTGPAYWIIAIVGGWMSFRDPGLKRHVFGRGGLDCLRIRAFWMLVIPLVTFVILFLIGLLTARHDATAGDIYL